MDEAVQQLRHLHGERRDPCWHSGEFLTTLLVASHRARRGELLSSRKLLQIATIHLATLVALAFRADRDDALDSLDPVRRFEQAFPSLGHELNAALDRPPFEAARLLLGIALRELPPKINDFPADAARAIERHLR